MKIKIKLAELYNIIEEEYQLMNGNGSAWGLPGNWASKVVPVEVEEGRSTSYSDVREEYEAILDFLKKIFCKSRAVSMWLTHWKCWLTTLETDYTTQTHTIKRTTPTSTERAELSQI